MNERSPRNSLAFPLLAGLVGVAIGILFAPRSGRETRERMKQKAHDTRGKAEESMEHAKERMEDGLRHARKVKEQLAGALKVTGQNIEEGAQDLKNQATQNNSNTTSPMREDLREE